MHARAVVMREGVDREDAPHAEGGWLTWLADCGDPGAVRASTPARWCATSATRARCAAASSRARWPRREAMERVMAEPPMDGRDLAREVTPGRAGDPRPGQPAARGSSGIDTGIKDSIVRNLRERGVRLELHPCTATADELLAREPDAVFLANGPGDPAALDYVVETVRELVGKVPVWGICLGHQLLCRAVGLETFKLPFGHRGANHPVKDLATGPDRHHQPEPRLRGARPGRRAHDRHATSRCAGRPTSAPPSCRSSTSTTARSRAWCCATCRPPPSSTTPRPGPGPHDALLPLRPLPASAVAA